MRVKTSELQGAALDWAVAKCEGMQVIVLSGVCFDAELLDFGVDSEPRLAYTTDWAQGGPIIEREEIQLTKASRTLWRAEIDLDEGDAMVETQYGATPLIAAMRCYVASKLGDEIDIPEELFERPRR
jgi:hypothetical protein